MGLEELSPLLTLLDQLLGHKTPLVPPPPPPPSKAEDGEDGEEEGRAAGWDLTRAFSMEIRFLQRASPALKRTLRSLGYRIATNTTAVADRGCVLCLRRMAGDGVVSRGEVRQLIEMVEARLGEPEVVLEKLRPTTELVMRGCVAVVNASAAASEAGLDTDAVSRCHVHPGMMFGEEWSVGLETAWQASGAEGILTMPNFQGWNEAHARHKLREFMEPADAGAAASGGAAAGAGALPIPWGRLWRYQYWECLRTPCHEVIHLIQHCQKQSMNVQIAEHDGSYSTYLLMLGVEQWANNRADAGPSPYFPGAVESSLMESIEYVRHCQEGRSEESRRLWNQEGRELYRRWRDSFGVADMSDVWGAQGNFGGELKVEALCKNMLSLEVVFREGGHFVGDTVEGVNESIEAMLTTMFGNGRTGELNGVPVQIHPKARLAGMDVGSRLDVILKPVGEGAAGALLLELSG